MSRSLWNSSNYLDTSTIRFFEQVCQPCNQVGFCSNNKLFLELNGELDSKATFNPLSLNSD